VDGEGAQLAGEPGLGPFRAPHAEGGDPVVDRLGGFVGELGRVFRGPLGPRCGCALGFLDACQPPVQDGGDASGAGEVGRGDPPDEGGEVLVVELAFCECVLQGLSLRLAEVTLVFVCGQASFQFAVDGLLCGVSRRRSPDVG
jgi:hypothetical protein